MLRHVPDNVFMTQVIETMLSPNSWPMGGLLGTLPACVTSEVQKTGPWAHFWGFFPWTRPGADFRVGPFTGIAGKFYIYVKTLTSLAKWGHYCHRIQGYQGHQNVSKRRPHHSGDICTTRGNNLKTSFSFMGQNVKKNYFGGILGALRGSSMISYPLTHIYVRRTQVGSKTS